MYEILIYESELFSTSVLQHYGTPPGCARVTTS